MSLSTSICDHQDFSFPTHSPGTSAPQQLMLFRLQDSFLYLPSKHKVFICKSICSCASKLRWHKSCSQAGFLHYDCLPCSAISLSKHSPTAVFSFLDSRLSSLRLLSLPSISLLFSFLKENGKDAILLACCPTSHHSSALLFCCCKCKNYHLVSSNPSRHLHDSCSYTKLLQKTVKEKSGIKLVLEVS